MIYQWLVLLICKMEIIQNYYSFFTVEKKKESLETGNVKATLEECLIIQNAVWETVHHPSLSVPRRFPGAQCRSPLVLEMGIDVTVGSLGLNL